MTVQLNGADLIESSSDVENGTFITSIGDNSLNGSAESQVYTTQTGFYTKISDRVHFNLTVLISDLGTLTTTERVRVLNLPFTSRNTSGSATTLVCNGQAMAVVAGTSVNGLIDINTNFISMYLFDATTGVTTLLISELSAGGQLVIAGDYLI